MKRKPEQIEVDWQKVQSGWGSVAKRGLEVPKSGGDDSSFIYWN